MSCQPTAGSAALDRVLRQRRSTARALGFELPLPRGPAAVRWSRETTESVCWFGTLRTWIAEGSVPPQYACQQSVADLGSDGVRRGLWIVDSNGRWGARRLSSTSLPRHEATHGAPRRFAMTGSEPTVRPRRVLRPTRVHRRTRSHQPRRGPRRQLPAAQMSLRALSPWPAGLIASWFRGCWCWQRWSESERRSRSG